MSWALSLRQFYAKSRGGWQRGNNSDKAVHFFFVLWPQPCGILVLQRGMELMPPVVEAES